MAVTADNTVEIIKMFTAPLKRRLLSCWTAGMPGKKPELNDHLKKVIAMHTVHIAESHFAHGCLEQLSGSLAHFCEKDVHIFIVEGVLFEISC